MKMKKNKFEYLTHKKAMNCFDSCNYDTLNTKKTNPYNQVDLNKKDNGLQVGFSRTVKIENKLLVKDKLNKNQNEVKEHFSFSSLEREITPDYKSLSDDSEFFLTKRPFLFIYTYEKIFK